MDISRRKNDSVFLLTLIDFLLQIIFFGLFGYSISVALNAPEAQRLGRELMERFKGEGTDQIKDRVANGQTADEIKAAIEVKKQLQPVMQKLGVSNYVELSDRLSKMVPLDQVAAVQDVAERFGGIGELQKVAQAIDEIGGMKRVQDAVQYYNTKGPGKPHCLFAAKGSSARPLGTLVLHDSSISIENATADLAPVLTKIDKTFEDVASLSLAEFTSIFGKVKTEYPNCLHSFNVIEKTRFVDARDAVYRTGSLRFSSLSRMR